MMKNGTVKTVKMKEKEDKKKALAEKRAARDAARKAKKAGEGEGGDA